jgi:hypothetical protein
VEHHPQNGSQNKQDKQDKQDKQTKGLLQEVQA